MGRQRRLSLMLFDVLARELVQVWTVAQADLLRFLLGILDLPAVTQNSPDHPKSADANTRGTMNKSRAVLRVVRDLEKLRDLFIFWIAESDRDIEVAQAQLFCFRLFFGSAMFARLAQVDDCFDAVSFQFFQMLEPRLRAG